MQYAKDRRVPWDAMLAWSQNLGHASIVTTLLSYGKLTPERQSEIMRNLANAKDPDTDVDDIAREIATVIRQRKR